MDSGTATHPRDATSTLWTIVEHGRSAYGARLALTIGERSITYEQLYEQSLRVAAALQAHGVPTGARIGVLAVDDFATFELIFGAVAVGIVVVPLNYRLAPRELDHIVADAGIAYLFVGPESYEKAEALTGYREGTVKPVALDGRHAEWLGYGAFLEAGRTPRSTEPAPSDVAVQLYTSGTTGRPKGALLPHRSFFGVMDNMREAGEEWFLWRADDVALLTLPMFHVGGLWWAVTCLAAGARAVIMPVFDPAGVLTLIGKHKVTRMGFVPAMLHFVLSLPEARTTDYSSVRQCVYGGSPIPFALLKRAQRAFGCEFLQTYGLTETGNTAVGLYPSDHREDAPELLRAAGRPYPGVQVRCIGPDGTTLPPSAVGEIIIHSPGNMVGYWNMPEATVETLRDGWIHTGDAGYIDEQGYVFIVDRVKDMILSAGENIYPAEVEEVIASHPQVREVAVIGVPHERWGETVKAIIVPHQPEHAPTLADILAHAKPLLAEYKLPRSMEVASVLPRTVSGKVQRSVLRAPYWAGRDRLVN